MAAKKLRTYSDIMKDDARPAATERSPRGAVVATLVDIERMRDEIIEAVAEILLEQKPPKLLDRELCAQWLGCSSATVDNLRRKGMPTIWCGDSPRFEPDAVMAWMRAQRPSE